MNKKQKENLSNKIDVFFGLGGVFMLFLTGVVTLTVADYGTGVTWLGNTWATLGILIGLMEIIYLISVGIDKWLVPYDEVDLGEIIIGKLFSFMWAFSLFIIGMVIRTYHEYFIYTILPRVGITVLVIAGIVGIIASNYWITKSIRGEL